MRLINGYDTFGNTCGVKHNEKYTNFALSGMNTLDKPVLFYFDVKELKKSIKICVKECPRTTLTNRNELYKYYQDTGTSYCRYNFNITDLVSPSTQTNIDKLFNYLGPCPSLPVPER